MTSTIYSYNSAAWHNAIMEKEIQIEAMYQGKDL